MMTALTLEKYHTLTTGQESSDKRRLNRSVLRGKKRPLGVTELQQVTTRWETPFHYRQPAVPMTIPTPKRPLSPHVDLVLSPTLVNSL